MRVTLDLDDSALARPSGRLNLDGQSDSVAFDGWLDLMRIIESLSMVPNTPGQRPRPGRDRED